MTAYRPKVRSVTASVLTHAGWVSGTFSLPPIQGFLDFLNQAKSFLKLSDVTLPDGTAASFLAVPRAAALAVVPDARDTNLQARGLSGATVAHKVLCLFGAGVLEGTLETASNLRVSDYLLQHSEFIAIRDAEIRFATAGDVPTAPIPFVAVNAGGLIGVSEVSAP